jgi:hypothetical protein
MKVKAHLVVSKGYGSAIVCSQWIGEMHEHCEVFNREHFGPEYLSRDRERAVVTVEFEVPDNIFHRDAVPQVEGKIEN